MLTEPNNTISTASPIVLTSGVPTAISGTIGIVLEDNPGANVDLFKVDLNELDQLTIDIDTYGLATPLENSFLCLFDANGNELASNNHALAPGEDYNGWRWDSYIDFTALQAGTYYIGVSSIHAYDPITGVGAALSYYTGDYSLELNWQPVTITLGTPDTDDLRGTNGNDSISGFAGNDKILALAGLDVIWADLGNDVVGGGRGNDTIDGGLGNDRLSGQAGNDEVRGGRGNDIIFGEANSSEDIGNDKLFGDFGNDRIFGGQGNDTLEGDLGNDRTYAFTLSVGCSAPHTQRECTIHSGLA